ncbi:MAG: nucleotidyltransferase family protein [Bacteroidales bacterium]|nr:nucleotidyltransferase family protein [Bacteroidales bacterium]
MKAMILSAGLGTRLRPFTDALPKALIPYHGIPMIERVIHRLINEGFNEIIINIHHFADQIREFIAQKDHFGVRIEFSDETERLLDTGGGLINASWFFDDQKPFLVHNVDISTDLSLREMYHFHCSGTNLATLAVKKRISNRYLLFDEEGWLSGWEHVATGEKIITRPYRGHLEHLAFSGIQVISPELFPLVKAREVFSLVELYLRLSEENRIGYYSHDHSEWLDLGKIENLG